MLQIQNLSFRIQGRPLLEAASVFVPEGHRVGLVGRNGAGKTTLLDLITGVLAPDEGNISLPKEARVGRVYQEAPASDTSLIDTVLAADTRRARLLADAENEKDPSKLADIHQSLIDMDAYAAPSRAATLLAGLGFDEQAQRRACKDFSGGWRMRVALAALLFTEPDLLLLDEPTNYLDLEGTMWLEGYLAKYRRTALIVSHDRQLLNNSVDSILSLHDLRLRLYTGNFDQFERAKAEQQALQAKLQKKQEAHRKHMEAFVERFRYKASKARQAQSRLKAIQKLRPIAALIDEHITPITLPEPGELKPPIITMVGVHAGYQPGQTVLKDVDFQLDPNDRVALLGANGNGKSTFAKILSGRLQPTAGEIDASSKLKVGYFAQHQLDELDEASTPFLTFSRLLTGKPEKTVRAQLGARGFGIEKADNKIKTLSGGEKARLLLAIATFDEPHLLILDEPTNHLDVDSRESLIHALNDFGGAIVLISHDQHLIETCADRLFIVGGQTVRPYEGDLSEYKTSLLRRSRNGMPSTEPAVQPQKSRREERQAAADSRAMMAPLRKEVAALSKKIEKLERHIAKLDDELLDPDLYSDNPQRASQLNKKRTDALREMEEAENAWLIAQEKLESATSN